MKMRCCLLFCGVFICFEFGIVDGLKSSQKGVCVSKHTVTKTRPKTVLVQTSKWCGAKKCTVKQTRKQKYTVVTNQLMCCKGYVYTSDTDSCAPVCSTGCANGTCIDPDVCHCAGPSYLDPTTKNKCLTPTCDYPCVNGQCTVNNTCLCKDEFSYYNETHCVDQCLSGFELDSSLKCVKKENSSLCAGTVEGTCRCACVNGRCVGDKCVCDKGFVLKNGVCQRCGECKADGTCSATFKDDGKRPDGVSLVPWTMGRMLVWDATCVDTLAPSQLQRTTVKAGGAAHSAENLKFKKYKGLGKEYHFVPFGVETLGPWGPSAHKFFGEVAKRQLVTEELAVNLAQRISIAIQRGNAANILGTMPQGPTLDLR